MVHEAMSESLAHLYTHGSITIATLCNGSLLTDIILGTKAGAAKKGLWHALDVCCVRIFAEIIAPPCIFYLHA